MAKDSPFRLRAEANKLEFRAERSRVPSYRAVWLKRAAELRDRADLIEALAANG